MPVGKVKWYDANKGFGFASNPGDADVFVGKNVLPKGVDELLQASASSLISLLAVGGRRRCV